MAKRRIGSRRIAANKNGFPEPRQMHTVQRLVITSRAKDACPEKIEEPKWLRSKFLLANSDAEDFIRSLPATPIFDLVITSPPYNLGKEYEVRISRDRYLDWQRRIIQLVSPRLKSTGSVCWQVGNYVENGTIDPLDILIHPVFAEAGLKLRNRIIWQFGHGLHCQRRFSGRYEVILWYTKTDRYHFDLDAVRVPAKYPAKRFYKGPRKGELSSNPNGKNPEDVWMSKSDVWPIPNVKGNHREKTNHPCQFPVGLVERLALALTKKNALVFDPFVGVGSAGVAAAIHGRRFWGCDLSAAYLKIAEKRISDALAGEARYRPHTMPVYDHRQSSLSRLPACWTGRVNRN